MTNQALAIGTFDGVHLGHRAVLDLARGLVGDDGTVTAVTFWPHPLLVVAGAAPPLLQSLAAREDWLLECGADEILLLNFTPELAALTPAEFVERMIAPLAPVGVAIGENFTFGVKGAGTPDVMGQLAAGRFEVLASPTVEVDGLAVSSSAVRGLVLDGEAARAAALLGRDFAVRGIVVHGDHRGRLLGFPTANVLPDDAFVTPADGVYAGWLRVVDGGEVMSAAVSVGNNPTFGVTRRVEAHVLGVDMDLYDLEVEIGITQWLRGVITFGSIDELKAQLSRDVAKTAVICG